MATREAYSVHPEYGIKIKGRIGKWSAIDKHESNGIEYLLFESDIYGDETDYSICKWNGTAWEEVACTFDDIETGLSDEGIID